MLPFPTVELNQAGSLYPFPTVELNQAGSMLPFPTVELEPGWPFIAVSHCRAGTKLTNICCMGKQHAPYSENNLVNGLIPQFLNRPRF